MKRLSNHPINVLFSESDFDAVTWFQYNRIPVDEITLFQLEVMSKNLGHENALVTLSVLYTKQDLLDAGMDPKKMFA